MDRSQPPLIHDVECSRSTKRTKLTNSMKIRVNTICPGIFPSEMTGVNSSSEREGHNYNMGDAANKAAARSTAGK
jgi:NAD(P)-dependent dehydrogenase (short-subunit alcohol dehydrogenase family)